VTAASAVTAFWIVALALIQFFWFPGHTILQSDTQIYLPMLERIWDPSLLGRDLVATRPHLTFTLYDEVALALRAVTGAGFETVLLAQQFAYRALAIAGLYLIARAFSIPPAKSLLVAGLVSLGAAIIGPAVLTVEYEPVPRAFALPFVLLSWGLLLAGRPVGAGIAASCGLAFHPPTAIGSWFVLLVLVTLRRDWRSAAALASGPVLLAASSLSRYATAEPAHMFGRLDDAVIAIQRMRAAYNWVSVWIGAWWPQYAWQAGAAAVALWRIRQRAPVPYVWFAVVLPLAGILSVPLSYLLLEGWQWSLVPQFQPARYLLFVTFFAMLNCALAGVLAAEKGRYAEACAFFVACLAVPREFTGSNLEGLRLVAVVLSALLAVTAAAVRTSVPLLTAAGLLPYVLLPTIGSVRLFPEIHKPEMAELVAWARSSTPKDAVFQFEGAGRSLLPGVFRARAQRAIWVDWKTGGQVNFQPRLAEIWHGRWRLSQAQQDWPQDIDYVVVERTDTPDGTGDLVYSNAGWAVYRQ
jgi:hypothetical protein